MCSAEIKKITYVEVVVVVGVVDVVVVVGVVEVLKCQYKLIMYSKRIGRSVVDLLQYWGIEVCKCKNLR